MIYKAKIVIVYIAVKKQTKCLVLKELLLFHQILYLIILNCTKLDLLWPVCDAYA